MMYNLEIPRQFARSMQCARLFPDVLSQAFAITIIRLGEEVGMNTRSFASSAEVAHVAAPVSCALGPTQVSRLNRLRFWDVDPAPNKLSGFHIIGPDCSGRCIKPAVVS